MKVTLDLSKLLEEGKITREEHEKLLQLSLEGTGSLAFNILIAFGVVAVSGGALALVPSTATAMALGVIIAVCGLYLGASFPVKWGVLANVCTLIGALLLGGGLIREAEGSAASFLIVAAVFTAGGIFAKSGLLISLAVLSLSSSLGARTAYFKATYCLGIEEPGTTVIVFTLLALITFGASKQLKPDFERLAIIASRTSVFMVNFGFWIRSLWGDLNQDRSVFISEGFFSLWWAVALLVTGLWAARQNRAWVVNTVATFGAFHLYTQWFENFGASPATVVIAGMLAIAGAVALRKYNFRRQAEIA